jgi:3-oxoacyl-[acyl-carrier-protein] synthase II
MDSAIVVTEPDLGPAHERRARRVVVTGAATLTAAGLLGSGESAELVSGPPRDVPAGRLEVDFGALLDVAKARRLDRPARLGVAVAARALAEAGGPSVMDPARTGVVLGSAFGSVDPSAAFMHRVFEKGPRLASPAEFPNLVPSSPVGHVSIYAGLRGATLATADLATSGECAVATGAELVAQGEADAIVAGSVEEASDIAERILVALFARSEAERDARRSEGAAAVVLESEERATARGAKVLARLEGIWSFTNGAVAPLASLAPPKDFASARVILARDCDDAGGLVDATSWRDAPRLFVAPRAGQHEGLGGIAVAAAAGLLAQGTAREVLVVGLSKGRGFALTLAAS